MKKSILPTWIFWIGMLFAVELLLELFDVSTEQTMKSMLWMAIVQSIPYLLYSFLTRSGHGAMAIISWLIVELIILIIFMPGILIFKGIQWIHHLEHFIIVLGWQTIVLIYTRKFEIL